MSNNLNINIHNSKKDHIDNNNINISLNDLRDAYINDEILIFMTETIILPILLIDSIKTRQNILVLEINIDLL